MIEIKADGQAELRLLELLYPASPATPTQSGIALVTAETQQRIADLTYLVQTQQVQLEQAVTALNDYQQTVAALTGFSPHSQPLLPPASPSSNDSNRAASSSRRYITGGLGQSDGQRRPKRWCHHGRCSDGADRFNAARNLFAVAAVAVSILLAGGIAQSTD